jgi:long-chain acyl-CoA synthetase
MKKTIFLTGSTGLVGRHLLSLILNNSDAHLVLLIRGNAKQRFEHLLSSLIPDPEKHRQAKKRVTVVKGNLTSDRFGLSVASFEKLSNRVTHIIHSAASVKFDIQQEDAYKINIYGTKNVINLAKNAYKNGNLNHYGHISTAYVSGKREGIIYESELNQGQAFSNIYEKTKCESESLVKNMMNHLPVSIYRPSVIVGDSNNGFTTAFNVLYAPIRLIYEGKLKYLCGYKPIPLDVVPIDFVSRAIYHIFLQRNDSIGKTFHITAGQKNCITVGEIIDYSVDYFNALRGSEEIPAVRFIAPDKFKSLVDKSSRLNQKLLNIASLYAPYLEIKRTFDRTNTEKSLYGTGITTPNLGEYLTILLDYSLSTNWGCAA